MKISLEIRRKIIDKLEKVLQLYGVRANDVQTTGVMFQFWTKVCNYTIYPSDNPNALFKGERVFDQDETWERYPCDSNDDHLDTALLWCFAYLREKEILKDLEVGGK